MLRPAWGLAVGIFGIACAGVLVRLAMPAPPVVVGFYRMAFASVALLAGLSVRHWRARKRGAAASLSPRGLALALIAGAAFGSDIALWHHSLVRTTVANATLLVNTTPIYVGLFTALVLRQPLGWRFALGASLALAGAALLLGIEVGDARALRGDGLALTAALFYTGYILVMTRARETIDALSAITCMSVSAAATLGLYGLLLGDAFSGFPLQSWLAIGAAAVVSQLIGAFAIVWALRFMQPLFTSVALIGQPVIAAGLAWLWLGEAMGAAQAVGTLGVLAGIAIVSGDEHTRAG